MTLEFGYTDKHKPVTRDIKSIERGLLVGGLSGTGKTTLLHRLIASAIPDCGILAIVPDDQFLDDCLDVIPPDRANDTLLWDPARQQDRPWAANLWHVQDEAHMAQAGDWFKYGLRAASPDQEFGIFTDQAAEYAFWALAPEGRPISDIPRLFRDRGFRLTLYPALKARNQVAYDWFLDFDETTAKSGKPSREQQERSGPLVRRIEQLITNPIVRSIVAQSGLDFDIGRIMAERKILLVRLSEADLGPGARQILANLLMAKVFEETKRRQPEQPPFLVVIDEANSLAHRGWTTLIEQSRKFRVAIVLAQQGFQNVRDPEVRNSLLLIPNKVCFQIAGADIRHVATSYPDDIGKTLPRLPKYQALARLDNDDPDPNFTVGLLNVGPIEGGRYGLGPEIKARSHQLGRPREEVEREIQDRDHRHFRIDESVVEEQTWS